MRGTRPRRDIFSLVDDENDEPSIAVRRKIGSGSFGEALLGVVASHPYSPSILPGPALIVVKRCIIGRMKDDLKSTRTSETRETLWARELGGLVPWREILDEEGRRVGVGAESEASSKETPQIFLPLAPTFAGAALAHESGEHDRVFHLLATASHGTSIYEAVTKEPARFASDPSLILSVATQVLRLVAELHSRAGAVHRDIKLQNLLLQWSPSGCPVIRLCDLGSARVAPTSASAASAPAPTTDATVWNNANARGAGTPYVTSLWYRAPELLAGSIWSGPPADVWAVAVCLSELYSLAASLAPDAGAGEAASKTAAGRREGVSARISKNGTVKFGLPVILPTQTRQHSTTSPTPPYTSSPLPPDTSDLVTLFHCGPEDAYAVLSIINILGIPSSSDITDLRLPSLLAEKLKNLCDAVRKRAGKEPTLAPLPVAMILNEYFSVPRDVANVIARMLQWSPSSRLTCAEALCDRAFASGGLYQPPRKA